MNIRHKLYTLGIIAILGSIAIFFTTSQFAQTNDELNRAINQVDKLEVRLLNLRRNEKTFYCVAMPNIWIPFKKILTCSSIYKLNSMPSCSNMSWVTPTLYVLTYWNTNRVLNSWCVPIKPSALIRKVACGKATIRRSSKPNNKLPQKSY